MAFAANCEVMALVVKFPDRKYHPLMEPERTKVPPDVPASGLAPRHLRDRSARSSAEERPWPVKAITLLLFLQGLGFILGGLLNIDFTRSLAEILSENIFFALLPVFGVGAWAATLGFFSLRPGAWVVAMLVQGLSLLLALFVYFILDVENLLLYAMMFYSIIMVIYLNYAQVPALFRSYPDAVTTAEQRASHD